MFFSPAGVICQERCSLSPRAVFNHTASLNFNPPVATGVTREGPQLRAWLSAPGVQPAQGPRDSAVG